ncbi:PaaI family thioesterase [Pseudomonas sp. R3.Fl]|uniref:PaaI family thioesterase n=1 Tax=Pseudomonas TaxID=286 RepID=UPI000E2F172A|nr:MULTISPECIES: PaaI family thioesterase [Pseudomonas]MCL6692195.1 PaaI family thioesterase [Pseudomonas sp. R3.Fl]MDN6875810.1 PaaI family thioesterase [Pseudomonas citronellolis]
MLATQDHYPEEFAHCYDCGTENENGHKLKSYLIGDVVQARFLPDPMYSGGYPGNAYGGLIASLLDCHGAASAAAFCYLAENRQMGDEVEAIRFVTGTLTVVYRKPTPLCVELSLEGKLKSLEGRKAIIELSLSANGQVCATGEMIVFRFNA